MTKHLMVFIWVFLLHLSSGQAQTVQANPVKEYVFEVPRMDVNKRLPEFKSQIQNMKGVEFGGLCESRSLLMIKMPSNELEVVKQILQKMGFTYYLKEDASFIKAYAACENPEEIENSKTIN